MLAHALAPSRPSRLLVLATLALAVPSLVAHAAPDAPLPPELPWSGDSRVLLVPASDPWATPFEKSGRQDSPPYEETVDWLRRLVEQAPELSMTSLGTSHEGREVWMIVASREGAKTPEELRANRRPTLLVQAGIHSGEIDGKDAGMMLLRDMTVRGERGALLDRANLLFVPILSVDGHERGSETSRMNQRGPRVQGWRTNARNLNLNRDYAKLDTPEVRAIVTALDTWAPDLYIDIHVTDGADYQYDVTYGWNGAHSHSPEIVRWLERVLRPAVDGDLRAMGHVPGPLVFFVDRRDPSKGIWGWTAPPRLSHGYGDARHVPTVLIENHSLKPFEQRVLGTYVLLESAMRVLGESRGLREAMRKDRERRLDEVPLGFKTDDTSPRPTFAFLGVESQERLSSVSGQSWITWTGKPVTLDVPVVTSTTPLATATRPAAYWIPPSWPEVIEKLRLHGIAFQQMDAPSLVEVEMYRLDEPTLDKRYYEGHVRVRATPRLETRVERYPKGSIRVPTDQPLGTLAMLLLEPASLDSFFQWGFFSEVLSRTEYAESYVLEALAEKMLADDAGLAQAFREKLATDAEFRADGAARLRWFYERTPYFDERWRLYPVGREPRGEGSRQAESSSPR